MVIREATDCLAPFAPTPSRLQRTAVFAEQMSEVLGAFGGMLAQQQQQNQQVFQQSLQSLGPREES